MLGWGGRGASLPVHPTPLFTPHDDPCPLVHIPPQKNTRVAVSLLGGDSCGVNGSLRSPFTPPRSPHLEINSNTYRRSPT